MAHRRISSALSRSPGRGRPPASAAAGFLLAGIACVATALQVPAEAQRISDVLVQPAAAVSQPGRGALVDIAAAGHRLVAVGERGFIGLSDDGGKSWRQAPAPVSV